MNRTTLSLSVALTALAAFGAGYAVRGGVKSEAAPEAAAEMKVTVRQVGPASHGPGMRAAAGSSAGQMSGQRAFPKGEVAKWLEGLKDIDPEDAVAMAQLCRKCWAMEGEEAAELLAKCGEILLLQDNSHSPGIANFPQTRGEIEAVLDHPTLNQADFTGSVDEADPGSRAPSRAEELLGQMPASGEKSELLASKARGLMNSRPDEARLWVEQMPEGPEKVWLTREAELKAGLRLLELEKSRAKAEGEEQEITPDD